MRSRPAPLPRGLPDRGASRSSRQHVFIYIRGEYLTRVRDPRRCALERGTRSRSILGGFDDRRPPWRRRLHLRARRRRCWSRWRASAASRASQPPFPPVVGLYAAPDARSTTSRPSPRVPGDHRDGAPSSSRSSGRTVVGRAPVSSRSPATSSAAGELRARRSGTSLARADLRARWRIADGRRSRRSSPAAPRSRRLTAPASSTGSARLRLARAEAGSTLGSARAHRRSTTAAAWCQLGVRVAKFDMHESCGKCTPCREGTRWMVQLLQKIEAGEGIAGRPRPAARASGDRDRGQVPLRRARRLRRLWPVAELAIRN